MWSARGRQQHLDALENNNMSQGKPQYPIQEVLRRIVGAFESDRTEFVQNLGCRDLETGRLHLDSWLDRGEGHDGFLQQVADAFPDHAGDLGQALIETAEMKAAERGPGWRERCKAEEFSFVPFIHVQGEQSVPSGITMFGLSGGHARWTTIHVPAAILRLPVEEQLTALPEMMKAYLEEFGGMCPFFGLATKFLFVRFRDYHVFDRNRQFVERVDKPFRRGHVEVSLR
jgi:hypothetical protein